MSTYIAHCFCNRYSYYILTVSLVHLESRIEFNLSTITHRSFDTRPEAEYFTGFDIFFNKKKNFQEASGLFWIRLTKRRRTYASGGNYNCRRDTIWGQ